MTKSGDPVFAHDYKKAGDADTLESSYGRHFALPNGDFIIINQDANGYPGVALYKSGDTSPRVALGFFGATPALLFSDGSGGGVNVFTGASLAALAPKASPTFTGTVTIPAGASITSPTIAGHPTVEGVAATGATGTGKLVFDASPALTGTPTAPTPTGPTGIATKGYADKKSSTIIDDPGATYSNDNALTTLCAAALVDIPPDTLAVGDRIEIVAFGTYLNNSGAGRDFSCRVLFDAVQVATVASGLSGFSNAVPANAYSPTVPVHIHDPHHRNGRDRLGRLHVGTRDRCRGWPRSEPAVQPSELRGVRDHRHDPSVDRRCAVDAFGRDRHTDSDVSWCQREKDPDAVTDEARHHRDGRYRPHTARRFARGREPMIRRAHVARWHHRDECGPPTECHACARTSSTRSPTSPDRRRSRVTPCVARHPTSTSSPNAGNRAHRQKPYAPAAPSVTSASTTRWPTRSPKGSGVRRAAANGAASARAGRYVPVAARAG